MQREFVFSGFGGQGVMFAGQLLAYAAMNAGKQVTWIPSYGPEMRGGTAHCFVIISDKMIGSPVIKHPSVAVIFNSPSFDKYETEVSEHGLLVVNQSLVPQKSTRTDIDTLYIPATEIAEALGNIRLTNVVLLGAMLQHMPIIPLSVVETALSEHIPPHRRELLDLNIQALQSGRKFVQVDMLMH